MFGIGWYVGGDFKGKVLNFYLCLATAGGGFRGSRPRGVEDCRSWDVGFSVQGLGFRVYRA